MGFVLERGRSGLLPLLEESSLLRRWEEEAGLSLLVVEVGKTSARGNWRVFVWVFVWVFV